MTHKTFTRGFLAMSAVALSLAALFAPALGAEQEARKGAGSFMLERYDADGDGLITLQEFQAAGDAMFTRMDADGDGYVSAEEWAAAAQERGRPMSRMRGEERRGDVARAERFRARWFERMDADGDGRISRAEWDDARLARFSTLDVNGNGVIDPEELRQCRHGRKGARGNVGQRFKHSD